ncbi:MAG: LysE family transporter [Chitinophagaceae bacterium]
MFKLVLQFIIGFAVGIYGYFMPGYINLQILQYGTYKKNHTIWKIIFIISLVEIPYCFFCMSGMNWLMQQGTLLLFIKWIIVALLVFMALLSFKDAGKRKATYSESEQQAVHVNKLLWFAIFNPFQLSAWTIWGTYFIEKTWFDWNSISIFIFSIGAALGVLLILRLYAMIGKHIVSFFSLHRKYIDYTIGAIMLLLAAIQLIRNIV